MSEKRLGGRVALVTGASQGFGERIARHFVQEGASVAAVARSADKLTKLCAELTPTLSEGQAVLAVPGDVSQERDIEHIVESVLGAWGRVDILVNCAGTAGPRAPLEESDWAQWREALELNLFGPAYLCRCIIPHMKRAGRGKIINISGGGATKAIRNLSSYGASKTGLVRLTETLALELAENAIDVNAVAPGLLATKMADDVMEIGADILGTGYSKEIERQRRGEHDAFARATALCVFLASSESDGITGRLLSAPWDPWASLPQRREELSGSDIYTLRRIVPEDRGHKWDAGS
ncbi:MAG: SDR family oxidoreductase [Verrucomicrobia bacterium]|nr:SDR family oxidoreductase [Kiritimatiellia bacterium]MCO6399924.1 SDR family oxidoreductase [Verrucomicrobiota bacterium]